MRRGGRLPCPAGKRARRGGCRLSAGLRGGRGAGGGQVGIGVPSVRRVARLGSKTLGHG